MCITFELSFFLAFPEYTSGIKIHKNYVSLGCPFLINDLSYGCKGCQLMHAYRGRSLGMNKSNWNEPHLQWRHRHSVFSSPVWYRTVNHCMICFNAIWEILCECIVYGSLKFGSFFVRSAVSHVLAVLKSPSCLLYCGSMSPYETLCDLNGRVILSTARSAILTPHGCPPYSHTWKNDRKNPQILWWMSTPLYLMLRGKWHPVYPPTSTIT